MKPIKGVPVEMTVEWMQGVGRMLLRNATLLQEEFGCRGLIPAEQQGQAERLMNACKDVLRAETAWHGSSVAAILFSEEK